MVRPWTVPEDLTGHVFGKLTVVSRASGHGSGVHARWFCVCSCGKQVEIARHNLITYGTKSCASCAHKRGTSSTDLLGKKFGSWTVLRLYRGKRSGPRWWCRCACGALKAVLRHSLVSRQSSGCQSCNARRHNRKRSPSTDLLGRQFGSLSVIAATDVFIGRVRRWLCECACGKTLLVSRNNLLSGNTTTCGCSKTVHGPAHFNWKGGEHPRSWRSTGYFRKSVRIRDGFKCVRCASSENLEVHHVFPYKLFTALQADVNNGVALCAGCHVTYHKLFGKKERCNRETLNAFINTKEKENEDTDNPRKS
jgi:5-methylcytosine-specific restriction endonuclease McrA